MPTLTIRNVDAVVKEQLRVRAARHGQSMEAELRQILKEPLAGGQDRNREPDLAEAIRRRFLSLGGADDIETHPRVCISQWDIQGEPITRSTVFTTNRSQAVRLPEAVGFPEGVHQVDIIKIGQSRLVCPMGKRWDDLFANGPRVRRFHARARAAGS